MKYTLLFGFLIMCYSSFAQVGFSLSNAVIIGQFDKPEDRFSIEINTTELLSSLGIKSMPSLNLLKTGADSRLIATDSIKAIIRDKGFDTYLIISVKGYDRRFKVSERQITLEEALGFGNLFNLYREEISSITFEFSFFRNDKIVFRDMIKCENVSDRNSVIKKYRKKLSARIQKKWRG